jgi:phospholipid/cholesterol/gamma-HCH transport system substrate-binding protein
MNVDNTTGLVNGAPVTLGGYKIGDVENVEFIPTNNNQAIKIKLRLLKEYQNRITQSSHAEISSIGILGDKFINITVGIAGEAVIAENSAIPVSPSVNLDNISQKLSPGIDNLNTILKNLSTVSDSIVSGKGSIGSLINQPETVNILHSVILKIDRLLSSIENQEGTAGKLIAEKELYNNLNSVAGGLNEIINGLKNGEGTLGKLIVDDSLYDNINLSVSLLNNSLSQAQDSSSVIGRLLTDQEFYVNLNDLINDLRKLVIDIKENPDRYVRIKVF